MAGCCAPTDPSRSSSDTSVVATGPVLVASDAASKMATIAAGSFAMGNDDDCAIDGDGEGPVRQVHVDEFLIDRRCVTNAQFAAFVRATGYVTEAERYGWSFVFGPFVGEQARRAVIDGTVAGAPWWQGVSGACWHRPQGPGSTVDAVWRHPVVHVTFNDAQAYACWIGKRLPTEAEWEKAARGGLAQARYPWGDELTPGGRHQANIWQGVFPSRNTAEDGYVGTAPVDAFTPNRFGLYQMAGNVWEWCADYWSNDWHAPASDRTRHNPHGPQQGDSRVMRGGSHLCHVSYCERYRVAARTHATADSSTGHTGFRLAADGIAHRK